MLVKQLSKKLFILLSVFFFVACVSRKELVYYQDFGDATYAGRINKYEIKIQPDDLLMIIVTADEPSSAIPFNLTAASIPTISSSNPFIRGQESIQSYLVDQDGNIDFPILGKLKIGGMLRSDVMRLLESKIRLYVKNPIVTIRLINFKVSVQGEVNNPGVFGVNTDRITLIEALTLARDLTIFGKRDNILIIREVDGVKSFNRINITDVNFINSPFYYLAQNDVIYVEPNKARINGAAVGANTNVIISVTSLLITITALVITSLN
jgi:polysaccharide export outer membrane protein